MKNNKKKNYKKNKLIKKSLKYQRKSIRTNIVNKYKKNKTNNKCSNKKNKNLFNTKKHYNNQHGGSFLLDYQKEKLLKFLGEKTEGSYNISNNDLEILRYYLFANLYNTNTMQNAETKQIDLIRNDEKLIVALQTLLPEDSFKYKEMNEKFENYVKQNNYKISFLLKSGSTITDLLNPKQDKVYLFKEETPPGSTTQPQPPPVPKIRPIPGSTPQPPPGSTTQPRPVSTTKQQLVFTKPTIRAPPVSTTQPTPPVSTTQPPQVSKTQPQPVSQSTQLSG